jgi:hypothetical protein
VGSIICGPVAQLARSKPQQQETIASDLALKQCERIIRVVIQKRIQFNGETPEQYRKIDAGRWRDIRILLKKKNKKTAARIANYAMGNNSFLGAPVKSGSNREAGQAGRRRPLSDFSNTAETTAPAQTARLR